MHIPSGEETTIFEASERYLAEGTPLIVIAGKEYGSGSSRDWAAKGPNLLGVRAAIAESYERIHRSNLIGVGIVTLQYLPGESATSLGLTGTEVFDVHGLSEGLTPGGQVDVVARGAAGDVRFRVLVRVDGAAEVEVLRSGGILRLVIAQMLAG